MRLFAGVYTSREVSEDVVGEFLGWVLGAAIPSTR